MATPYYSRSSNQGRRRYLNPDALEFHPQFHTLSANTSITNSTTNTNCYFFNYYPNNSHNFPHYYNSPPLLPHNNILLRHAQTATADYQSYPYHHHHRNNHDLNLTMQPAQARIGLGQSAASPVWPKSPAASSLQSEDSGAGARRRRGRGKGSGSGSSSNCERKKGFKGKKNDEWSKGSRRSSFQMIMPVKPDGRETTAMIRNIPNQYTRGMLIKFVDEFCRIENQKWDSDDHHQPLAFDFLYLPMDFKRDANKGYAFVNFSHPIALWKLHLAFSNRRWEHCKSFKVCGISCAAIQGKERLVEHFGRSKFVCDHEDYLPVCFSPPRDGSNASVAETTIGQRFSLSSHLED